MFIDNLYTTKITANKYNLGLDETVTITVTLTDFNGNPVANEPVTLYYDKKDNNRSSPPPYLTVRANLTTDSNGVATYTTSESHNQKHIYVCNGKKIEVKWDGWRQVSSENNVTVYESFDFVKVQVNGSIAVTTSWKVLTTLGERLRPYQCVATQCYYGTDVVITVRDNGDVDIRSVNGSWTPAVSCEISYAKK